MEDFVEVCRYIGLEPPGGLLCLLFHEVSGNGKSNTRDTRKWIYRQLYDRLVSCGKVVRGVTIIYPDIVKDAVRRRWPDAESGQHDGQHSSNGTRVNLFEIFSLLWGDNCDCLGEYHPDMD